MVKYKYFISYRYFDKDDLRGYGNIFYTIEDKMSEEKMKEIENELAKDIDTHQVIIENFILMEEWREI